MDGRIPRLETELEYAPTSHEELIQAIGSTGCTGECHMAVCTQDRHHLVFGTDLSEPEKLLKSHPDYIMPNLCRAKHEVVHRTWDRSQPVTDEFAVGYLLASPLSLGSNQRRKLKEIKKGLGR